MLIPRLAQHLHGTGRQLVLTIASDDSCVIEASPPRDVGWPPFALLAQAAEDNHPVGHERGKHRAASLRRHDHVGGGRVDELRQVESRGVCAGRLVLDHILQQHDAGKSRPGLGGVAQWRTFGAVAHLWFSGAPLAQWRTFGATG